MEKDSGLSELPEAEKLIFYAFVDLESGDAIRSSALRGHSLLQNVPVPTYHRALKSLLKRGLIEHDEGTKASHYRLASH